MTKMKWDDMEIADICTIFIPHGILKPEKQVQPA